MRAVEITSRRIENFIEQRQGCGRIDDKTRAPHYFRKTCHLILRRERIYEFSR